MTYSYPTAFSHWDAREHEAMQRVIASGRFTMGEEVEAFEAEFAAYHGMKHAIMVNSGSSANLLAVACIDSPHIVKEVSVPALSWATLYAPLVQYGWKLTLRDCDDTWNAPRSDHSTIFDNVVCPILGNPAHLADKHFILGEKGKAYEHVPGIVDCCESLGAIDDMGKRAGTQGVLNTFSFFYSHQLCGIEGGMILTNIAEYAHCCRLLRNHGWQRGKTFEDEYNFTMMGYNVRPVEMHAAVAREQLKKLNDMIAARWENYTYWLQAVQKLPIEHPRMSGKPSMFGIPFAVASKEIRSNLARALRAESIDCRPPVGGSFTKHPYGAPWRAQPTPNADRIHDTGIFLGLAPYNIFHLIDRAIAVMRKVL